MKNLNFYHVDMKYIRALAQADSRVMSISPQDGKDTRPFVGIIVVCGEKKYCIPLTSPKAKHQTMKNSEDFSRIINDSGKIIGALNFNNMIPVRAEVITQIDLRPDPMDIPSNRGRKLIMNIQLDWCNKNRELIARKANKLHHMVTQTPEKFKNLTRRCCDFLKLEAVLERYVAKKAQKQQGEAYIESLPDEQVYYLQLSEKALQVLQQDGSIPMVVRKKDKIEYLAKIALTDKPKAEERLEQAAKQIRKK